MCTPCHGVPAPSGPTSAPVWNHAYDSDTHDGSLWLYTKNDGAVDFDDLSDKCLGCHDGTNFLQDYAGYTPQYTEPTGVTGLITAFAVSPLDSEPWRESFATTREASSPSAAQNLDLTFAGSVLALARQPGDRRVIVASGGAGYT